MAPRLKFQNVPTKTGGVISGNVSIASGSPFGAGGKHAGTIAHVQSEIAKKPKGYYDPVADASGNVSNSIQAMEVALGLLPKYWTSEEIETYAKAQGDARRESTKEEYRLKGLALQTELRNEQLKLHADALTVRLNNGQLVAPDYFQNSIVQRQAGVLSDEDFLRTYKILWDNGTIHEKIHVEKPIPILIEPTPEPEPTPSYVITDPISPVSYLPFVLVGIVLIGIFLLRRKA